MPTPLLITPPQTRFQRRLGVGQEPRRHRKILRDNIQGITKGTIRRLARRGGVKRIQADIYGEIRTTIKKRLTKIVRELVELCSYCDRKIVRTTDIVFVLRKLGTPMYGFDEIYSARPNTGLFG